MNSEDDYDYQTRRIGLRDVMASWGMVALAGMALTLLWWL